MRPPAISLDQLAPLRAVYRAVIPPAYLARPARPHEYALVLGPLRRGGRRDVPDARAHRGLFRGDYSAEYNLPLTQIQIGSHLRLTAVHVNRTVRLLRDERIVQMEKHCVTILDLERLTNMAQHVAITNAGERALREAAD
jgi:Crp-like helix-turn-helix protein